MSNGLDHPAVSLYRQQKNEIEQLSPRHRAAMRRLAGGESLEVVASDLGFSKQHLGKIARSPLFKREMQVMMARLDNATYDALSELRCLQPDAIETLRDLVNQVDLPQLRFAVAKDILDRTGVVAPRVQVQATQTYEEKLAQVRSQMTVTTTQTESQPSPIRIMGGDDLIKDFEKDTK